MVVPKSHVDLIADPGPYASTHVPQLEYEALASVFSDAATVNTPLAPAGDASHASALSFPAATARNTPEFHRLVTAWASAAGFPPPSAMLATAGLGGFAVSQSAPALTSDVR